MKNVAWELSRSKNRGLRIRGNRIRGLRGSPVSLDYFLHFESGEDSANEVKLFRELKLTCKGLPNELESLGSSKSLIWSALFYPKLNYSVERKIFTHNLVTYVRSQH